HDFLDSSFNTDNKSRSPAAESLHDVRGGDSCRIPGQPIQRRQRDTGSGSVRCTGSNAGNRNTETLSRRLSECELSAAPSHGRDRTVVPTDARPCDVAPGVDTPLLRTYG